MEKKYRSRSSFGTLLHGFPLAVPCPNLKFFRCAARSRGTTNSGDLSARTGPTGRRNILVEILPPLWVLPYTIVFYVISCYFILIFIRSIYIVFTPVPLYSISFSCISFYFNIIPHHFILFHFISFYLISSHFIPADPIRSWYFISYHFI